MKSNFNVIKKEVKRVYSYIKKIKTFKDQYKLLYKA